MNIIIVGNSPVDRELGSIIDQYDMVVRLGGYVIEGFERLIGTKTDMHITGGSTLKTIRTVDISRHAVETIITIPKNQYITNPTSNQYIDTYLKRWSDMRYNHEQPSESEFNNHISSGFEHIEHVTWAMLEYHINELDYINYEPCIADVYSRFIRPTIGSLAIQYMSTRYDQPIDIVGFDKMTDHRTIGDRYYSEPSNGWIKHNLLSEQLWLMRLIHDKRVHVIS